jgi:GTPase SAR1 family protein
MSTERLIEHKAATLDIYKSLIKAVSDSGKRIPESVVKTQQNLEANKFLLAVVGKVKAGKSTFINALLTQDILPTDSLQATAAIIEISHSKTPFLRITYANGHTEEVITNGADDPLEPLIAKLQEVAAIAPDQRDIPIAQLNDFIIDHHVSGTTWEEDELSAFIDADLPKILKQSPGHWQQKSRDYLAAHQHGRDIAKTVEVGYPTNYQFEHFRIVDTPGICAKGGFDLRTHAFLSKADAVIYLHKEEPSEDSLHNNLAGVIPEKVKEHLHLIFTHRSTRSDEDNQKFLKEAVRSCPSIPESRIFLVDSLTDRALQSFYDLKKWEDIAAFRKTDSKTHKEWRKVTASAFEEAEGDRSVLLDLLETQSNMRSLKTAVFRLSEESLKIQINTLLDAICLLYAEIESDEASKRDIHGKKLKDPQQFSAEMARQKNQMDELEAEAKKRIRNIRGKFDLANNKRGEFGPKLETIINKTQAEVSGKDFQPEDTAKSADDFLQKIQQDIDDKLDDLVKKIKQAFRAEVESMEIELDQQFDLTVPKIALIEILEEVTIKATETKTRKLERPGLWNKVKRLFRADGGWEIEEYEALNATKFFKSAKAAFLKELPSIKSKMIEQVTTGIESACNEYNHSINEKLNQRRDLIAKLEADQQSNSKVKEEFDAHARKAADAQSKIEECNRIKGAL